ncbi:prephenate dehydratase domain-containing protein [Gemmatimonadota bacterium Y43]|uniref:prephenate dehydratase domain-containing protein n=1 Tax=Gaopeijia maritima TaxID=3119007 RepID=UPI003283FBDB
MSASSDTRPPVTHPTPAASAPSVGYQGEPGAFSELALRRWFGGSARAVPLPDFETVLARVRSGEVDFAILPVENTLAGSVAAACDAFLRAEVDVAGEVVEPIRHQLLALPGTPPSALRRVSSHPVALDQCRAFLARHPHMRVVTGSDTAGAARAVAEGGDPAAAAIASEGAGERYGLEVIARDIHDRPDNQTRFWVLRSWGAPMAAPQPGVSHSMLVFETRNEPGALARVLRELAEAGLNLKALTARPAEEPWHYRFIAEVEGDLTSGRGAVAIASATPHMVRSRVVGPWTVRGPGGADGVAAPRADAAGCRRAIDAVDRALVRLLAQRRDLAARTQSLRTGGGDLLRDPAREAEVLRHAAAEARAVGLPEESVRQLFWRVIETCHPAVSEAPPVT